MQDIIFFISNHIILSITWIILVVLIVFSIIKDNISKFTVINNIEAIKLVNKDNAIIIDTRSLECFKKGHIVNSINIPLKNIFLGDLQIIEPYKLSPIILIFYQSDEYDKCVKEFLKNGFHNVFILKNGIDYWTLDNLPLVTKDM